MKEWDEIPKIDLYSDGGAEPNPGNGGYGIILFFKGQSKEFSQGYKLTTNNRMELLGVIAGLEKIKTKSIVNVYTDSKYVVDGIEKGWAEKWRKNNWFRTKQEKAKNFDLWSRLLELISKHEVEFNWVKGHSGHPENERCDILASKALRSKNLLDDKGFEDIEKTMQSKCNSENIPGRPKKVKIRKEGDLCRDCNTPVIKKIPKRRKLKPNQVYYFEYYMSCPSCNQMYHIEEAKKYVDTSDQQYLF